MDESSKEEQTLRFTRSIKLKSRFKINIQYDQTEKIGLEKTFIMKKNQTFNGKFLKRKILPLSNIKKYGILRVKFSFWYLFKKFLIIWKSFMDFPLNY